MTKSQLLALKQQILDGLLAAEEEGLDKVDLGGRITGRAKVIPAHAACVVEHVFDRIEAAFG